MAIFDDLIKRAAQFVEKQKGVWDHSKWQGFAADIQKKGVKLTEEMQNYLGLVLESLKKFSSTSSAGREISGNISTRAEKLVSSLSEQAATFVEKTRGKWEHLEWEKFLKDSQQRGIDLTEETMANLRGLLESAKKFYSSFALSAKEERKELEVEETPRVAVEKAPEKEEKPSVKKKEIKKAGETRVTGKVKPAPSKKKAAKESTVKKPAVEGTTKTKATSAREKKPE